MRIIDTLATHALLPFDNCTSRCHAIPRIVVQLATPPALDGSRSCLRRACWTRGYTSSKPCTPRNMYRGTKPREVPRTTTTMTFLRRMPRFCTCIPQTRTIRLDMTDPTTPIALFSSNTSWFRTRRAFVAGFAAVEAKPRLRACVGGMSKRATFEAAESLDWITHFSKLCIFTSLHWNLQLQRRSLPSSPPQSVSSA